MPQTEQEEEAAPQPPAGVAPLKPRWVLFTVIAQALMAVGTDFGAAGVRELMSQAGFSESASRSALNRMVSAGWLELRGQGTKRRYRVTPHLAEVIYSGDIQLVTGMQEETSLLDEGLWCLVIYEVPESMRAGRDRLRRQLEAFGFGRLAAGVWASARDRQSVARRLAASLGLNDRLVIATARLEAADELALVKRCWDLDDVQAHYEAFLTRWQDRISLLASGEMTDQDCFREDLFLISDYRWFLRADPGLRPSLLPSGWLGGQAAAFFRDYHGRLTIRAESHVGLTVRSMEA